ncbi:MAG: MBG domain-containing protein [Bacillota bacterium]|nr:MBG domain-containing protein [Bacillota bacterium]
MPSATVTISNPGNLKSQGLQAQENSRLNVTFSKNEIDADGSITATVTPKENLTAGEYTEVITVKGSNNEKIQFTVNLKVKEKITFEVSDTVHVYKAGETKNITFVPSALSKDDFVVKYYEVDENNGVLKSTLPVSRAIASGCYLYVIDLAGEQEDYGIGRKFTVTDTTIPEFSAYDNVGYMYINATAEQQLPIYFDNAVVNAHMTDTVTNPLNNPNASTVTYESKNTSVAEIDAGTGAVTIKGAGSAVIVAVSKKKNASDVYASYTLNVTKEAVTVTADSSSVEYGTEKSAVLSGYTVSKEGVTFDGTPVYTTAYEKGSGCGQYSVSVSGLTSDIYEITYVPGTLTVTPKKLSLSDLNITAADKVYDGSDKAELTAAVKDSALVSGDIVNVLVSGSFAGANASDSEQTVSYTVSGLSGTHSGNYTLAGELTGTASAKISKAPVTVSVPPTTTYIYDGEEKSVNAVAYANGMYFDKFNVTYTKDGAKTTPKGAGTYDVGIEITDSNYVLSGDITAQLIIRAAQQDFFSIEGIADTVTYGDAPFRLQADGVESGATVKFEVTNGTAATVTENGEVTITGVGPVTVRATSTLANHTEKTAARTFTVKPKTLNVTAEPKSAYKVYDGTKTVDVKLSLDGVVTGDTVTAGCAGAAAVSADVENNKTVFVNGITLSGADAGKYQLASTSVQTSVNVTKKPITAITFNAADKVYDGSKKADYAVTELEGVLADDRSFVTVSGSAEFEDAAAGEAKTVTLSGLTLSGTKSGNYELKVTGNVTAKASISKAKVVFTLGTLEYTYDGTKKTVPVSATVNGTVYSDYTVEYRVDGTQAETVNAGEYDVVITLGDTANYETDYVTKKLKIVKASQSTITITGLIGTIDYGAEFALSAVGGNGSGAVTWASSNTAIAEINENTGYVKIVGTGSPVTITATKAGDENFGGEQTAAVTFTPVKKSIGFKVTNLNQTYDGTAKSVTVIPSAGSDNYTVTYTDEDGNPIAAPAAAGIYYADVRAEGNYEGDASAVLTIKNASVDTSRYKFEVADAVYGSSPVVTQPDSTKYPRGVTAKVTYTGSGIYSETTVQPKNAGSYTAILTISGENYETVKLTDSFVITKAELTAKPDNKSRAYGEQNPVFTVSYSGFVNGDNESAVMIEPSMTTDATVSSGTGTYAIKASGGYAENYTFNYEDGTLTVGTAGGGNFYINGGQSNPYVGDRFTLTAYYNNEKPAVTWTSSNTDVATVSENGEVEIISSGQATITAAIKDTNYSGESADFTLTASKKRISINVAAGELVKTYNGARQDINFTSSDIDLESNNIKVKADYVLMTDSGVTEPKQAGVYAVSYMVDDSRYTADGNVTLTINKAELKAKVKDDSKVYGDEYTNYDIEITDDGGLVEAAAAAALAEMKTVTTCASDGAEKTASVKDGGYEITAALSNDNVKFIVESGILTITKAPLTIKVKDVSREYGAENPALDVEYEGFKNGETEAVLEGSLVLAYDESINSETAVGTYDKKTTAGGLTSGNYEVTFVPGNVTVTKISVKASAGTARSSYLTIRLDRAVEGLTSNNFVVKKGDEIIAFTETAASSDNMTYTLKGTFSTADTYTVEISLRGTECDATHEITSEPVSISPSSGGGGGGAAAPETTYTVTFETNGGGKIDSVKVSENGKLSEPAEPVREGYIFEGWYSDKELTTVYDFAAKVTKSFTIYAKWTEAGTEPDPEWNNPFTDVSEDDWFFGPVLWAVKNGITTGTSESAFSPYADCTRAQIVTFLWRAAGCPEPESSENPFSDVTEDAYYCKAVLWAVEKGITQGTSEGLFSPELVCTRHQSVTFLWRAAGKPDGGDINPFTDVKEGEWYTDAVLWAVGESITEGTGSSTFSPDENCTRGQIVTFLYRCMNKSDAGL